MVIFIWSGSCNQESNKIDIYLHEQESDYETRALAVADLSVEEWIGFHHIKEALLTQAVFLLEEVVLRVGPGNVPPDDFFTGRSGLDEIGILLPNRGIVSTTQKGPHDTPEMMLHALSH